MLMLPSLRPIHPLFQFAWPVLTRLGDGMGVGGIQGQGLGEIVQPGAG